MYAKSNIFALGARIKTRKRHSNKWVSIVVKFAYPIATNIEYWNDHIARNEAKRQAEALGFNGRTVIQYWVY